MTRSKTGRAFLLLIGTLLLIPGLGVGPAPAAKKGRAARPAESAATRATMAGVLDAVSVLLPLSYRDRGFEDPAQKETISDALRMLSAHADHLAGLGRDRDAGFGYLARALAEDTRHAEHDFRRGRPEESRGRVQMLTEHCIACHTRLPSDADSPLGVRLLERVDATALPLPERAHLEQVTRQFSAAMGSYEELLAQADQTAGGVVRLWNVVDYLTLSVRVMGDLERPVPTLEAFAARSELPEFVRHDLEVWTRALRNLQGRAPDPDPLADARALIDEGRRMGQFPADRAGLVHYLVASSELLRFVDGRTGTREQMGEAYYLLGGVEGRAARSSWLSQPEFYLETAIRMAPGASWARRAFGLLEWHVAVEYAGSGGLDVPEDVRRNLDELRALISFPEGR